MSNLTPEQAQFAENVATSLETYLEKLRITSLEEHAIVLENIRQDRERIRHEEHLLAVQKAKLDRKEAQIKKYIADQKERKKEERRCLCLNRGTQCPVGWLSHIQ